MPEPKFKAAKKSEVASLIERALGSSVKFYDSKLAKERQNVLDYYNAVLPKPVHAGNSKYVSMDVFDAVESMKAVLLETFSAGHRICQFDPQGEDDVPSAAAATEYCDYVVHRQNSGYDIFASTIQDSLMARVGIVKVYWDKCEEEIEEEFSNLTADEVDMLLASDDVREISETETDPITGLISGELIRVANRSQVRIDPVAPEEFLITPTAKSLKAAPFVAHRTKKSISDLLEEGYDEKKVLRIGGEGDATLEDNEEVLARFEAVGASNANLDTELQEQSRLVWVYECYLRLDLTGKGRTKLYKVVKAGKEILDIEQVDRTPFKVFTPLPLSHSFYGSNYAAKVIPTQNARTVLVRGILDHTVQTNNPRYQVVKGAVTNPKELLENRIGGLVNVTRPDGILPFPQAALNPFVFQTINLLDEDKEEVTGVSKLSQGLNKDAVSQQNSQGLVENLVSLSQQREKIIARNFGMFVRELYLEVFRLVLAHEDGEKVIEVAGEFLRIAPWEWDEQMGCTVDLKLGYGEQEREGQKFMGLHGMLMNDPEAKAFYTLDKRYAVYKTVFEKMGVKNVAKFITPPDKVKPQGPDPMVVKKMELEERHVVTQEKIAEAQAQKVGVNATLEQMRIELDRMQAQLTAANESRALDIKEFDATSKAAIAAEELTLAQEQVANTDPANAKSTAIISPN